MGLFSCVWLCDDAVLSSCAGLLYFMSLFCFALFSLLFDVLLSVLLYCCSCVAIPLLCSDVVIDTFPFPILGTLFSLLQGVPLCFSAFQVILLCLPWLFGPSSFGSCSWICFPFVFLPCIACEFPFFSVLSTVRSLGVGKGTEVHGYGEEKLSCCG